MTKIDSDTIRNIVMKNGTLFVPESITDALSACVVHDYEEINSEFIRIKLSRHMLKLRLDRAI